MQWFRDGMALAAPAVLALATAGCVPGGSARGAGAEAAVRAVLEAQLAAWNRGDLDGFMDGYWRSDSLAFYSGEQVSRGCQATRERYMRRYKSEGREMGTLDFELEGVTVEAPDRATVQGEWRLRLATGSPHGTFTLQLRRFPDAGWKIVEDRTKSAAE